MSALDQQQRTDDKELGRCDVCGKVITLNFGEEFGHQESCSNARQPPEDYLTVKGSGDGLHKPNEWYCKLCNSRVTRIPSDECEAGHAKDCAHSIYHGDRGIHS